MEPLNDDELRGLLREWHAPPAPPTLEARLFSRPGRQQSVWKWLLSGSIRVPVPVALAAIFAFAALSFYSLRGSPTVSLPERQVDFADFQPVKELKPIIIRSTYEIN